MQKTLFILAGVTAALAASATQPTFKQVASIDVSAYFTSATSGDGAHGSLVGGVAAIGDSIYLSGWTTGANNSSGVVRITGALGTPTISSFALQAATRGGSRMTKLVAANDSLYWGFGMGEPMPGTGSFGVRRLNPVTGADIDGFGGADGILDPAEWRNQASGDNRRIDTFDYDHSTGRLVGLGFFNGVFYNADPNSGAATGSGAIDGNPTSWRDAALDENGNLYSRRASVNNLLQYRARTDATNFGAATLVYGGTATEDTSSISKVSYVPGIAGFDPMLLANATTTGASEADFRSLLVMDTTGTRIATLKGDEDGFARFGSAQLTGSYAEINGKLYLLVAHSAGSTDTLRVYEVVPEPGTMIALGAGLAALAARRRRKSN